MRTIKFRGKNRNKNEWVNGDLVVIEDGIHNVVRAKIITHCFAKSFIGGGFDHYSISTLVEPETICQFTGLLDKNDKEIYEGDIVKYYTLKTITIDFTQPIENVIDERCGVITYDLSSFVIKDDDYNDVELKYYSKDYQVESPESVDAVNADKFPFITNENDLCKIEVIGNIHDNPELLENNA